MEHFLAWEYLLSFAGCVTGTALLTEFIKRIFDGLSSKVYQIISFLIAFIILLCGQMATKQSGGWPSIALDAINAAVVSLTANGGYDAVHSIVKAVRPKTDEGTELVDEGDSEE